MIDIKNLAIKCGFTRCLGEITVLDNGNRNIVITTQLEAFAKAYLGEWLKEQEVVGYLVLEPSTTMTYVSHYQPNNSAFKYDKLIALPSEVK